MWSNLIKTSQKKSKKNNKHFFLFISILEDLTKFDSFMAGLLTYLLLKRLPVFFIEKQWLYCSKSLLLRLTAAGLYRTFTYFPFNYRKQKNCSDKPQNQFAKLYNLFTKKQKKQKKIKNVVVL